MTTAPLLRLTVVVPAYNAAAALPDALTALAGPTPKTPYFQATVVCFANRRGNV